MAFARNGYIPDGSSGPTPPPPSSVNASKGHVEPVHREVMYSRLD